MFCAASMAILFRNVISNPGGDGAEIVYTTWTLSIRDAGSL